VLAVIATLPRRVSQNKSFQMSSGWSSRHIARRRRLMLLRWPPADGEGRDFAAASPFSGIREG
jgi:hypothetical protein